MERKESGLILKAKQVFIFNKNLRNLYYLSFILFSENSIQLLFHFAVQKEALALKNLKIISDKTVKRLMQIKFNCFISEDF